MFRDFKDTFVSYLTDGIPIKISEEDQPIFYNKLSDFVNETNNDFVSVYVKETETVHIGDKYLDYLCVSYKDSRILFRNTQDTNSPSLLLDHETQQKMGEAFLGVVIFVESLSPTDDSQKIPGKYYDQWKI